MKGRLNCDSDAPQVWSARSDWTGVAKVNSRKTNRRKTRPYCTSSVVIKAWVAVTLESARPVEGEIVWLSLFSRCKLQGKSIIWNMFSILLNPLALELDI